jgi:hypothetical protein
MSYDDRYLRGVGGWLAFLVIVLAVLTPLRVLVSTLQLYGDPEIAAAFGSRWALIQAIEIGLSVATVLFSWYLAWRLNAVEVWRTVQIVIAGLWILSLGTLALEVLAVSLIGGLPLGAMVEATMFEVVRGFVFAGIWTAYLLKSRRVANTYADRQEDVAEVFT